MQENLRYIGKEHLTGEVFSSPDEFKFDSIIAKAKLNPENHSESAEVEISENMSETTLAEVLQILFANNRPVTFRLVSQLGNA